MKYKVNTDNTKYNNKIVKIRLNGYKIPSKTNKFTINDVQITNITLFNKKLIHPFVWKCVNKKYQRLLKVLTDLFVSEDPDGSAMAEILNEIEKFKEEIKIKYRKYLKKKDLEEMSLKLKLFQKEAKERQINMYFTENERTANRAR